MTFDIKIISLRLNQFSGDKVSEFESLFPLFEAYLYDISHKLEQLLNSNFVVSIT